MPYQKPPPWLLGAWVCPGQNQVDLTFKADSTGTYRELSQHLGPKNIIFTYKRVGESSSNAMSELYIGLQNSWALAYSVRSIGNQLYLRNMAFYRDQRWNALPTQGTWMCRKQ